MKILYHHRTASRDGQAVHIEEMIDALRDQGHEVRVVAPEIGEPGEMGRDVGWVHRLKNALPRAFYELLELAYSLFAYRKLARAVREFKPDFVYERYNLYLLAGVLIKRRYGIPLLLEVNSPLVQERSKHSGGLGLPWLARWAEKKAWSEANFVLPVTKVLAKYVEAYGVSENRIVVLPNGINKAHFASAPSTENAKQNLNLQGKLVLGFTGFIRDWHGVDRVIDWMASDDAPRNAHLLIVGDGPVRSALEAQAKSLGLIGQVTFTGVVDRHAVPGLVAAFDIALQPAVTSYASPLKVIEYLALGKPIVAPRQENICELLTDGVNAILFDETNPNDFRLALTRICNDPEQRVKLSSGSYDTIDRLQLTWSGNASRVVDLAKSCSIRNNQ